MKAWFKHVQPLALATAVAVVFGACDESLEGGTACPLLCPQQQATIRDTTFIAVDVDTAIAGYPAFGTEVSLFLASFGDTLQTRGVARFDSLPTTFRHHNSTVDSNIVFVDTGAVVKLRIVTGDTIGPPTTIEVYDVDLGGADDADPKAVVSAFTPDRLLGSRTVPADSLRDSVSVAIDPDKLLAKIQSEAPGNRLRVGLRVTSASGSAQMRVVTGNGQAPPLLIFRPSADTSVSLDTLGAFSRTPAETFLAADYADYLVVATAPPDPPSDVIRVGGLPGRRAYMRFNIPPQILDSSNIVRATLLLTQRANGFSPNASDSVAIAPFGVTAGPGITDLSRALLFLFAPPGTDSVRLVAADGGVREFELIRLVKLWAATTATKTPRALSLRSSVEGISGRQIDFYSLEAAPALRPKLRITYLPRNTGGLR